MSELLVDFITSLYGYAAAEGCPGFWGLEGPEYLAWLDESPEADHTVLMGATTYRLMSGFCRLGRGRSVGAHRGVQGGVLPELGGAAGVGHHASGR